MVWQGEERAEMTTEDRGSPQDRAKANRTFLSLLYSDLVMDLLDEKTVPESSQLKMVVVSLPSTL